VQMVESMTKAEAFAVVLATLEQHQTEETEGDVFSGFEGHDQGYVTMGEIDETSISICDVTDLRGQTLLEGNYPLEDDYGVVPRHLFEDATPDEERYKGYMGNV